MEIVKFYTLFTILKNFSIIKERFYLPLKFYHEEKQKRFWKNNRYKIYQIHKLEEKYLFICLKAGQDSNISALNADSLIKLVKEEQIFDITRVRFLDENLNEM